MFCRKRIVAALSSAVVLVISMGLVQAGQPDDSLLSLGLGDLMKVKVVSATRRESDLGTTPAPLYVLTSDDIRRSGVTNLPDALRLIPGVEVARVNGNTWAVSARGFNASLANKMLVMIDGRTVYSQLFAGVFWDVQDIPLDTIDRIEVILGPGGTLWGPNAVNGIINIIRKPAAQRQGTSSSVTSGSEDRFIGEVNEGWRIGEKTQATAYARYREFDDLKRLNQSGGNDDNGRFGMGGFRADGASGRAEWMISGDGYSGDYHETRTEFALTPPFRSTHEDNTVVDGENILGKIKNHTPVGAFTFQTYFDHSHRDIPTFFSEYRDTVEADIQHDLPAGRIHTLTWGVDFRVTQDQVGNSFSIAWDPSSERNRLYSIFAQDLVHLSRRLTLTVGSKLEHNDYSKWEFQPSGRLGWEVTEKNFLWAGVSRAVRTPTRLDADARIVGLVQPGPTSLEVQGGERFDSEELVAYEAGYRAHPAQRVFLSLSTFYNRYSRLRSIEMGSPQFVNDPTPHTRIPFFEDNRIWGEAYGGEFAPQVELAKWWRVQAQYSLIHLRLHDETGSADFTTVPTERNDPMHQVAVTSHWNLPHRVELDGTFRWVDQLKNLNVPSYAVGDIRLGWTATRTVSMEVVGRNLFSPPHQEFSGTAEVEPSVHGTVSWHIQ